MLKILMENDNNWCEKSLCHSLVCVTDKRELKILIENDDRSCGSIAETIVYKQILDCIEKGKPIYTN